MLIRAPGGRACSQTGYFQEIAKEPVAQEREGRELLFASFALSRPVSVKSFLLQCPFQNTPWRPGETLPLFFSGLDGIMSARENCRGGGIALV